MKEQSELSPWQAWSLSVQQRLKEQQEQINRLQHELSRLSGKMKELEEKPTYHIDSINYKFDQLKVEKLEGTLNIGMSAPGEGEAPGNIEQLAVSHTGQFPMAPSSVPQTSSEDNTFQRIASRMNDYLNREGYETLVRLEQEYGLTLDQHHRRIIIEDVRKQMPARIRYYLQQHGNGTVNGAGGGNEQQEYPDLILDRIFLKTRRDADTAMQAYMRQLTSIHDNEQSGGAT
ncbi:spore germination protein GerPC [Paenibacillus sp. J5C_2022]|uniref:spore germination protein GerPC n=1 Tax=Paenibacillus sp. J5C2022 TaxID=2977129 RepID=UPI0021CFCF78|nr:spore germination protein GerPC [Paenibacillus sp. J5C2022]MCU6707707.1 spore germination protein GerPC [Paenibacillus sp. J5C2022]